MASGLASTTRFIGILLAVAGLGAVLADTVRRSFVKAAVAAGLSSEVSETTAKRVASGELAGMLRTIPDSLRAHLHDVGLMAFADGFSAAALLAAAIAAIACILTFAFVRSNDTAPVPLVEEERPCKAIDCRDPL
jgi:hypothetical protein